MTRKSAGLAVLVLALALLAPNTAAAAAAGDPTSQVYRFWNAATGSHFYTASEAEKQDVVANLSRVFRFEGVAYTVDMAAGGTRVPLHRFFNVRNGSHFYTASEAEKAQVVATLGRTYNYEGIAYYVSPSPETTSTPVYRFFNVKKGFHFYTASAVERDSVIANLAKIYSYEGVAYNINSVNLANSVPLYRFFNTKNGSHFYTASVVERDSVIANLAKIYNYEGEAYNVSTTALGGTPVWRFFNAKRGAHFYTASEAEKNSVVTNLSSIYHLESIAFYIGN
jgi:hypothetical protein